MTDGHKSVTRGQRQERPQRMDVSGCLLHRRMYYQPYSASHMVSVPVEARHTAEGSPAPRMPIRTVLSEELQLPGGVSRMRMPMVVRTRAARSKAWAVRAVLATLIVAVGIGGFLAAATYWQIHKVFRGNSAHAALITRDADPAKLVREGSGRINVLLLGIGGGTHEAPDLTDTIILASIDPVNNKADLLSVPRDLWVRVPGHGGMKLNAVYETGKYAFLHRIDNSNTNHQAIAAGFVLADQTISDILGITINYTALVDFQAFRQAVDTVGGVAVDVPTVLYDPTMAWENGGNPVLAKPGLQSFDGKHALIYVRSRETTSDFARSERQRAVLVALKDKVLTLGTLSNPLKISQLISIFGDNIQTDISLDEISQLAPLIKDIPNDRVASIDLAAAPHSFVTTDHVGNQSVVRPLAGFDNYEAIRQYVRSTLVDGYIASEQARVVVLAASAEAAVHAANTLRGYGYNVVRTGVAPSSYMAQAPSLIDVARGHDPYTMHYLAERLGVEPRSSVPGGAIQTTDADLIIVLGNDETFSGQA